MNTQALEQHIFDTVKEWQMKIGYRAEDMQLYYPEESLKELLALEREAAREELYAALYAFGEKEKDRLGSLTFTNEGGRFCISVPEAGCSYIHEQVPDDPFLKTFLQVLTAAGTVMSEVAGVFADYAGQKGLSYKMEDRRREGLGMVFYFDGAGAEDAVYCVEEDDFGLTYHRFTRADYQNLSGKP